MVCLSDTIKRADEVCHHDAGSNHGIPLVRKESLMAGAQSTLPLFAAKVHCRQCGKAFDSDFGSKFCGSECHEAYTANELTVRPKKKWPRVNNAIAAVSKRHDENFAPQDMQIERVWQHRCVSALDVSDRLLELMRNFLRVQAGNVQCGGGKKAVICAPSTVRAPLEKFKQPLIGGCQ